MLVMIGLFAYRRWRTPGGRFLLWSLGIGLLAALGTSLHVDGHRVIWLPWALLARLPAFDNMLPARFMVFVSLAAAVAVAVWAASGARRVLRIALPALAVVTLFPHFGVVPYLGHGYWKTHPRRVAFFTHDLYRSCLAPGANVLAFPYVQRGWSMLWQAEAGFRFNLAGGYIAPAVPHDYIVYPGVGQMRDGITPYAGFSDITLLARDKHIAAIVVPDWPHSKELRAWNAFLAKNVKPLEVGGVSLYPLAKGPQTSAACVAAGR
jgi:hypothetical protein